MTFLDRPGLPGPFGSLMDEYARAAEEFCRVVEAFSPAEFASEKPANDADTKTPRALCIHVVGAAHRYSDYIRKARGMPFVDRFLLDPALLTDPGQTRGHLASGLRYTEGALEGLEKATDEELAKLKFTVRWGPVYDPEMILEHAVVHLLRHRRQLERWRGAK